MASARLQHSSHHSAASSGPNSHHHHSTSSQPKSHAVAGVQDAYWSDEEEKDQADVDDECPLCVSKMDIDDLSFKPCPCGYQICRFCFHNIKENLNGRCPACRREYNDELVEFNPIPAEELKRLNTQKKKREKERKDIEALKRGHLTNVRIVQRNLLFVSGLGPRYMTEECIPQLKSVEFFGQYGKITKIVLSKRRGNVNGVYITYNRREDATRAISGVDGSPSPGGAEVMRASYGTTKYCMSFLRNATCTNPDCLELHDWGDDRDCFTKQDLSSLKHALKDTEHRQKYMVAKEADSLPRTASWGTKGSQAPVPSPKPSNAAPAIMSSQTSQPQRQSKNRNRLALAGHGLPARPAVSAVSSESGRSSRQEREKKSGHTPSLSKDSASSPLVQAASVAVSEPSAPPGLKSPKVQSATQHLSKPSTTSDLRGNGTTSITSSPSMASVASSAPSKDVAPSQPQQASAKPPPNKWISSPPTVPAPAPTPPPPAGYQMSAQARELINDVRHRREHTSQTVAVQSPFPDLDRTLSVLQGGDDAFTFNLDPRFASPEPQSPTQPQAPPYRSSFDPFSSSKPFGLSPQLPAHIPPPPGINTKPSYVQSPLSLNGALASHRGSPLVGTFASSSYGGSFDPFSEGSGDSAKPSTPSQSHLFDDELSRRGSRFGFARKKGSATSSNFASSAAPSPLQSTDALPQTPLYSASDVASPAPSSSSHQLPQWTYQQHHELHPPPGISSRPQGGMMSRPMEVPNGNYLSGDALAAYQQMGEAALKEMLNIGRNQAYRRPEQTRGTFTQYSDPAIMSMRMGASQQSHDHVHPNHPTMSSSNLQQSGPGFGPPPGLMPTNPIAFPPGLVPGSGRSFPEMRGVNNHMSHQETAASSPSAVAVSCPSSPSLPPAVPTPSAPMSSNASAVSSPVLSPTDFPALPTATSDTQPSRRDQPFLKLQDPKVPTQPKLPATSGPSGSSKRPSKKPSVGSAPSFSSLSRVPSKTSSITSDSKSFLDAAIPTTPSAITSFLASDSRQLGSISVSTSAVTSALPSPVHDYPPISVLAPPKPTPKRPAPAEKVPARPPTPEVQAPVLSRKAKKLKAPKAPRSKVESPLATPKSPNIAELAPSPVETPLWTPVSLSDMLEGLQSQLDVDVELLSFFDPQSITPKSPLPLRYAPLLHALAALSAHGHTRSNTSSSGTIDSAVSSFQQLLETLTQTISDLLRLLPRATWDESSAFDGVLRDMLKAEDFLDESFDPPPTGNEDEVIALTLALEKRARWMEVQLAKLEELHRDINTAAVRSILGLNDRGWDRDGFLPRSKDSLRRFEALGKVSSGGVTRPMSADELEEALAIAKQEEVEAEREVKRVMRMNLEDL